MNVLQVVVVVLSLGFISSSCGHANRKSSDGRHDGEPNGLNNNGRRCYANATLQLLAACFSKEIKQIQPFGSGDQREQIRVDLFTIVDHINAKEKRNTGDQKVMDAVRNLTGRLCPECTRGGYVMDFSSRLVEELGFLPDHRMFLVRRDTLSCNSGGAISSLESEILYDSGAYVKSLRYPCIRLSLPYSQEIGLLSDKALEDYWKLKEEKLGWHSNKQNLEGFERDMKNLRGRHGDSGVYLVEFTKLAKKLPPGTKFIAWDINESQGRELTFPYEEKSGCWQKFDLVGFVMRPGYWHFLTYVKRDGRWYRANDSTIDPVSDEDVDQGLAMCTKRRLGYGRPLAVYEARA